MPELPEVETVCRTVKPFILNRTITAISFPNNYLSVIAHCQQKHCHQQKQDTNDFDKREELSGQIVDQKIINVFRRGKYVIWQLTNGLLAFHLRMTGRLVHTPLDDLKHVTFALDLDDGNTIYFKDTRKFGRIYWYSSVDAFENSHQLGIEPLSDDFSPTYLENILKNYRQQIKPFLLNQKYLVGLGNIYVDEALWLTEIHPTTPCHTLSPGKIYQLHSSIQEILRQSIQLNGTTFLNFYFDKDQKGSYKELLNVFGRQGQKCNRCHDTIKKIRIAQRGTHYCATCQPVQQ